MPLPHAVWRNSRPMWSSRECSHFGLRSTQERVQVQMWSCYTEPEKSDTGSEIAWMSHHIAWSGSVPLHLWNHEVVLLKSQRGTGAIGFKTDTEAQEAIMVWTPKMVRMTCHAATPAPQIPSCILRLTADCRGPEWHSLQGRHVGLWCLG